MFGVAIDIWLATPNNSGMNTEASKIIDTLGGTAEVARLCDVRMPSVSGWRTHGIPKARMLFLCAVRKRDMKGMDIEAATAQQTAEA